MQTELNVKLLLIYETQLSFYSRSVFNSCIETLWVIDMAKISPINISESFKFTSGQVRALKRGMFDAEGVLV